MIRVRKLRAPQKLESGTSLTEQDCIAYDANSADYLVGTKKFGFKRSIYGHKSVKDALKNAQRQKCCFCEGRFRAHYRGDVEHYRPKRAVKQDKNAEALYPGYYWLVYSWRNLYYSCSICNSKKSSFFPLVNPAKRARSHTDSLADENPLILDPGGSRDPRNHIKFRYEIAKGVTNAGRKTIEIVDLNRNDLAEERLAHLEQLRTFLAIVRLYEGNVEPDAAKLAQEASHKLALAVQPAAVFSAMAADFLHGTEPVQAETP